jgi:copper resistance protein B
MKRYTAGVLVTVFAVLGSSVAMAQQSPMPPTPTDAANAMHMTPEEMAPMHSQESMDAPVSETHAADLGLERPALSQQAKPSMMAGMVTDMNDAGILHRLWIENLEGAFATRNGGVWDAQGWMGGDFDKLWFKTEGATVSGKTQDSKIEAFWAHAIRPFWDAQLGVRHDFSGGPSREWAAFGVQGISPYWFDIELTGYVGDEGRTAVRLKTEYDLYLTQRLILKPEIELNAYGKPDRARAIGAGLSDGQFEMRLRYEFTRRLAPYVGYVYARKFAGSATLVRMIGDPAIDHRAVAGLEFFF